MVKPRPPLAFDRALRNSVVRDLARGAAAAGLEPHPSFTAELIDFSERMAFRPLDDTDVTRVLQRLGYGAILEVRERQQARIGAGAVVRTAADLRRDPTAATGAVALDILATPQLDRELAELRARLDTGKSAAAPPRVRTETRVFDPAVRDAVVERLEDYARDRGRELRDSFAEELADYSERIGVRTLPEHRLVDLLGAITCDVVAQVPTGKPLTGGDVREYVLQLCPDPFSTCRAAAREILKLAPDRDDVRALRDTWLAALPGRGRMT